MNPKEIKISFCIVSMNRLHHLKETLIENILQNSDYLNKEIILLDYNSSDGMLEWAKENMSDYINAGMLHFYRTNEPKVFNHSHSKNLMFKLASGEVLCNINADHFTGPRFATYVSKLFAFNNNVFASPIPNKLDESMGYLKKDVFGKICVRKVDFLNVRGFDESMHGYGWEDFDFINRLELSGVRKLTLSDPMYLNFLEHPDNQRYGEFKESVQVHSIYISYLAPYVSEIIFLDTDYTFQAGTFYDNIHINSLDYIFAFKKRKYLKGTQHVPILRREASWLEGKWDFENSGRVNFYPAKKPGFSITASNDELGVDFITDNGKKQYTKITNEELVIRCIGLRKIYQNISVMVNNVKSSKISVNEAGYGKSIVFHNFKDTPIVVK